jgi:hypothetical protein
MAKTYSLIQAQTLTSTATSVTFSNIPQNFTDLFILVSCRSVGVGNENLSIRVNGSTSGYTTRRLYGDGSSVAADAASGISGSSGSAYLTSALPNGNTTSNTFANIEVLFSNYTSSSYKSLTSNGVTENIATQSYLDLESGLWANNSAITSITLLSYTGSNLAANSTFTLYGIGGTRATGGTITSDANFTYHTFTSSGNFTALEKIKGAEALLVAGGGGGLGGGGGAGGVVYVSGQTLFAGTSYSAIVGAGGVGSSSGSTTAPNGSNSNFSSFTALGGGGGGNYTNNGANGGSGGGAAQSGTAGTATQGSGTNFIGYGNNGATGASVTGGGGGGAGTAGTAGSNSTGGNGGDGTYLFSSWGLATNTGQNSNGTYFYAGGGGGGAGTTGGTGGLGGGSNGAPSGAPTPATANTGGGCGGGYSGIGSNLAGGSGLVIIRYPTVE